MSGPNNERPAGHRLAGLLVPRPKRRGDGAYMVAGYGPTTWPEPEVLVGQDPAPRRAPSLAPEHDWTAAAGIVRPAFRLVGTTGTDGHEPRLPHAGGGPGKSIVRTGPAGLPLVYVLPGDGFEVVVGVEHLMAWGVGPDQVHAAAMANLAAWSETAAWTDEVGGGRRVVSSDVGDGMDAVRILLPSVRARLTSDLAPAHRILVGVPERDVLVAVGLADGDEEFEGLFAAYVADRAGAADEPIDSRVFELANGELEVRSSY